MTSADTSKPSTPITKVTRFRTPDGLQFITYQAAQQHWSREQLIAYLKAHDWRSAEDLVDNLRQDWRISKRRNPLPVLDDTIYSDFPDIYSSVAGAL